MKFTKKLFLSCMLATLAIAAISITGCTKEESGDSVDDCMSKFKTAVNNGNYGDIGEVLYSQASKYSQATAASYWDTYFTSANKDFTYTVSGETAAASYKGGADTYTFAFTKDGDDYRILSIYRTSGSAQYIFN